IHAKLNQNDRSLCLNERETRMIPSSRQLKNYSLPRSDTILTGGRRVGQNLTFNESPETICSNTIGDTMRRETLCWLWRGLSLRRRCCPRSRKASLPSPRLRTPLNPISSTPPKPEENAKRCGVRTRPTTLTYLTHSL